MINSAIDFKKPRQKMWGILKNRTLATLPYGNETESSGNLITSVSTNCYEDALEQAHTLLAQSIGTERIQVVEFVPYNYVMQPNV